MQRWTFKQARSDCSCLEDFWLLKTYLYFNKARTFICNIFRSFQKTEVFKYSHCHDAQDFEMRRKSRGTEEKVIKEAAWAYGGWQLSSLHGSDPLGVTSPLATEAIKILKPTKAEVPFSVNEIAWFGTGRRQAIRDAVLMLLRRPVSCSLGRKKWNPWPSALLHSCARHHVPLAPSLFGPWGSDQWL